MENFDLNENDRPTKRLRSSRNKSLTINSSSSENIQLFKVPSKIPKKKKNVKSNETSRNLINKLNDVNNRQTIKINKQQSNSNDAFREPTKSSINNRQLDGKRLAKESLPAKANANETKDECYAIKYSPKTKTDLCIDKRKLAAIDSWFNSIFVEKQIHNRCLVLHGQTGCAKTSTIKLLAKQYDVSLFEFEEQTQTYCKSIEDKQFSVYVGKQIEQLHNFVANVNSCISKKDRERRKAILIKELPSTFFFQSGSSENKSLLHNFLEQYQMMFKRGAPIIFIITINDHITSTVFKRLFPPELATTLNFSLVELNGVIKKQIKSILDKINASCLVSKRDIECLVESSNGDLRSAINALEFLIESDKNYDQLFEMQNDRIIKSSSESIKSNRVVAIKDTSPAFFHLLGKIMYCKREGDDQLKQSIYKLSPGKEWYSSSSSSNDTPPLPTSINVSRRTLKESPERLLNLIECKGDSLATFIHECYLDFVDKDLNNAAEILSNLSFIDSNFSGQFQELDDYMKLIAIRGTMFNLNTTKEPVKSKKQFKSFVKPNLYTIEEREKKFRSLMKDRSTKNQFRSRDELIEILSYKERNLFSKLN